MIRTLRPHHIADRYIAKEKVFFIYGHRCKKCNVLVIRGGGGGGWVAAMTGRIFLPSYPLT